MAWTILYSIQDGKGKVSTTEVNLPTATNLASATAMAQQLATLINNVITGAIVRIGITLQVTPPGGLRVAAAANSDVEEGARFQYRTQNGFYSGLRIPTFDESLIATGSRDVNVAGAVATFSTAMISGIDTSGAGGTGVIQPCDKRGEDLVALEFAREQFLSSRG